jgi:hypothetical protein
MIDENTRLLEQFQEILKELTFHAKEGPSCQHRVRQLLDELLDELEFDR